MRGTSTRDVSAVDRSSATGRPDQVDASAARWAKAIELCRLGLIEAGYTTSTVDRVCKQVARFGRECGWAPWDVDAAVVESWLNRLDCAAARRYAYRTSLRTFYRWAHKTGRVPVDPTAETSRLKQARPAPDAWHAAVQAYRRHLEASKLSPDTIKLRCYQLVRAATELPAAGPWDVTATDLVEWVTGQKWSRGTLFSFRSSLRGFYGWAHDTGLIETNPAAGLPSVRIPTRMARPAPRDALRTAMRAADESEELMLRLAAELGLRRSEIAGVHSEDVQPGIEDAGWWLEVNGKGSKIRYLPLPDDLARQLLARPAGYVFPGQVDGHVAGATVTKKLTRLLPDHWTAHTLRHQFATNAYAVDHDLFAVQRMLGHARSTTTEIYVSVPESSMRRLVTAVSDRNAGRSRLAAVG